jgi:hypothetical protein
VAKSSPRRAAPRVAYDTAGDDDTACQIGSRKGFDQACNAATQVEIAHFVHTIEQDDDSSGSQVCIKEIGWNCDALSL